MKTICFIIASITLISFPHITHATIIVGEELVGFSQLAPIDGDEHAPNSSYGMEVDGAAVGNMSWSHTFDPFLLWKNGQFITTGLEMGDDGTIGTAEDPYIGRSWSSEIGSITFDLSGLNFSAFKDIEYIGLEFDSHENLLPGSGGSLTLKDNAGLYSSIIADPTDQFGAWSFSIPFSDYLNSSQIFEIQLVVDPSYGQWHSHGVSIKTGDGSGVAPVPEPTTFFLFGTGLFGLFYARHRKKIVSCSN